jgi:predicted nucleic acid-binding protein
MFLLDTNVISELRNGKPQQSAAVRAWAENQAANQLYLSAVTALELEIGVLRMERKDMPQGKILRTWAEMVLQRFESQVLPFTGETALICAGMHVPDPRSFRDSMIAATAQQHSLTLVTRNVADFEGLNIKIFNPWALDSL